MDMMFGDGVYDGNDVVYDGNDDDDETCENDETGEIEET